MNDIEKVALAVVQTLAAMAREKLADEAEEWVAKLLEMADEGVEKVVASLTTVELTSDSGEFVDESTQPEE